MVVPRWLSRGLPTAAREEEDEGVVAPELEVAAVLSDAARTRVARPNVTRQSCPRYERLDCVFVMLGLLVG